jgi:hypothetical protein
MRRERASAKVGHPAKVGRALNCGVAMYYSQRYGEVAERFKAAVLKTAEPVRVP